MGKWDGKDEKTALLHALDSKCSELELELQTTEKQLESVNRRLEGVKSDVRFYIGSFVVPFVVFWVLYQVDKVMAQAAVFYDIWGMIVNFFSTIYLLFTPLLLYQLVLSILWAVQNSPKHNAKEPIVLKERTQGFRREAVKPEKNYWIEQQKLIMILSKYYLKKESFETLRKQILAEESTVTMAQLKMEFSRIPYYEEIRPAGRYSGPAMQRTRVITIVVIAGAVVLSLLAAIW